MKDGQVCSSTDPRAEYFCLNGALIRAATDLGALSSVTVSGIYEEARTRLVDVVAAHTGTKPDSVETLWRYNDGCSTTRDDVMARLAEAQAL